MREIENEKPIVFVEGDEDRVVIEKDGYEQSLFSAQYTTAFSILERMLEMPDEVCYPGQGNSRIIAFCGDRGAGKTSCMMSVRHAIESRYEFDMLSPIDPSFFDESHNILELVLGQMYHHFKKKVDLLKVENQLDIEEVDKVKMLFDSVKRSLSLISNTSQRMFDKLEELENLSVAMTLFDQLKFLFDAYLKFMVKDKIVITIDDMDFNAEGAYRMCKFLQMYLNQPSCIVLISLKISQLVSILEDDPNFKNAKEGEQRSEMSSKYVQKLIPISNRVQMVDIRSISEREFVIRSYRNGEWVETEPERIKDGIVRMIFEKTRYLFYNVKGEVSPIIPHELRSFRQLLGMLYRMDGLEKYSNDPAVLTKNENNKQQFKSYFYTEWVRILSKEDRQFAEELAAMEDMRSFNKKIVSYLSQRADFKNEKYDDSVYHFRVITDFQNYTYNISTGDVFSIIRYLDKSTESTGLKDLLFFIKSCYSIQLYECYDEITDNSKEMNKVVLDGDVFKSDPWFRKTTKLQSLVNGGYFRYNAGSYIKGKFSYPPVTCCYDKLLLDATVYTFFDDVVKAVKEQGEDLEEKYKNAYRLAEFLILGTSFNYYGEYTNDPDVDRKDSLPYYLEPIAQQAAYVVFDITAIFANMINIKYTYDRFESFFDFYNYSDSHDWTLLGMLKNDIKKVRDVENYQSIYHAIASDAIIRNSEVLLSLTEMMESTSRRTLANGIDGAVLRYQMFLGGLYNTEMKTYRVGEDGNPYELHFSFIKTLSVMLGNISDRTLQSLLHSAKDSNENMQTKADISYRSEYL